MLAIVILTSLACITVLGRADITPLPVLVMLPFPADHIDHGWDRGLDLLPAARIAVREVNNRTDMLVGYEIQLIEASSDDCGVSVTTNSISNYVKHTLGRYANSNNAIAVVGLPCSSVTNTVSQLAGHTEIDLLQISMSNSPIFRNRSNFPRLWRILPSSIAFLNTTLSLFNIFHINRTSVVYDQLGVYFQTTAEMFRESFKSLDIKQELHVGIEESDTFIETALNLIKERAARIVYLIATIPEIVKIMCRIKEKDLVWPGYMWIIPGRGLHNLLDHNQYCANEVIIQALENAIILRLQINGSRLSSNKLVSGRTIRDYHAMYMEELNKLKSEEFVQPYLVDGYDLMPSEYANPLYDEVWALSLALNNSLSDLDRFNLSLKHYQYNMSSITNIIESHLQNVHFSGATSDDVAFTFHRETAIPVNVYQIRNGIEILIGRYTGNNDTLQLLNTSEIKISSDTFDIMYNLIPLSVAVLFYTLGGLIFVFITVMLILMLTVVYKEPEVKATSPLISLIIFVGAYCTIISSVIGITYQSFLLDEVTYLSMCITGPWLASCAMNVGLVTALAKLVRVHRVFSHFGKTGKIWKDKYLFFIIIGISVIFPTVVTVIFSVVSPPVYGQVDNYNNASNPPVNMITLTCTNSIVGYIGILLLCLYGYLIIFFVAFFAFRTRKIDRKDFKDTKKTLIYIFLFSVLFGILTPASIFFSIIGDENLSSVVFSILLHLNSILTIVLFLMPKVLPAICRRVTSRSVKLQAASLEVQHSLVKIRSWNQFILPENLTQS